MTFLDAIRSKYGPVRGVGLGPSRAAPDRIALSTEPAGDAVAEALVGEPLPSSRCADNTAEDKVNFSFDDTDILNLVYGYILMNILKNRTVVDVSECMSFFNQSVGVIMPRDRSNKILRPWQGATKGIVGVFSQ